ncbi:MAG TPA: DoxX family protein [Flavitalea sp.]|nr:DoxX family protein [Flavitalea sp.]HTF30244.1 DoxX family protein [Flavitalea sp.]
MSNKTRNILGWALVTIVAVLFIGSGVFKLSGASATIEMAKDVGGTANLTILGILELFIVTLFLVPRTGVVGALLMIAYMGGAMAVLFVSGKSIVPLIVIEILIWITATLRFPELVQRLFPSPQK